jgi:hypothetical protein
MRQGTDPATTKVLPLSVNFWPDVLTKPVAVAEGAADELVDVFDVDGADVDDGFEVVVEDGFTVVDVLVGFTLVVDVLMVDVLPARHWE